MFAPLALFARALVASLFVVAFAGLGACASWRKPKLCPEITLDQKVDFTRSEILLLCGDPKSEAWEEIPRPQVLYHLKTFLLDRGYYAPKITSPTGGDLFVELGPSSELRRLEVTGWPGDLEPFSDRRFVGRRLDSALLDEIETDANARLRSEGYACPALETRADAPMSHVTVRVRAGKRRLFGEIPRAKVDGFDTRLLERFEAFAADETYDPRLLVLSERRIRSKGFIQDAVYSPLCEGEEFRISLHPFVGKALFLSIGAGFDTEEWFLARLRFSAQRLSALGASVDTILFASLLTQSADVAVDLPFGDPSLRRSVYNQFTVKRQDTPSFESVSLSGRAGYSRHFDTLPASIDWRLGGVAEQVWTLRGQGPESTHFVAVESTLLSTSHLFEYWIDAPQEGYRWELGARASFEALGSGFTATRLKASVEHLGIVWEGPFASLVWAKRAGLAQNIAPSGRLGLIPLPHRHYLGGSKDLRGFSRQELPRDGQGAANAAFLGNELRVMRWLPIEPLLFVDVGTVNVGMARPNVPLYLSPGTGLRYRLPFGTVRGTAARGFSLSPRPEDRGRDHWEFFVSLGEEF